MISDPLRYVDRFIKAGADIITFHYEAVNNPMGVFKAIKEKEIPCGIAISPNTPVEAALPFVGLADMILVMTVEPGFGGQSFMADCLDKVRILRRQAIKLGVPLNIEVDGGINSENTAFCTEAGANVLVAGSALFKTKKPRTIMAAMREAAREHPFIG